MSQSGNFNVFRLRLNGNTTMGNSGILQVRGPLPGSNWVTVCPNFYATMQDELNFKSVVCRSLGYNSDSSEITTSSKIGFEEEC